MATYTRDMGQARRWVTVNTSGNTAFDEAPKAIRADGAGNIVLTGSDGIDGTFAVSAGEILPFSPAAIKSAGTTATGIKALY